MAYESDSRLTLEPSVIYSVETLSHPTVKEVLVTGVSECVLVCNSATLICIGIGVVSVLKKSIMGNFYWPLKILAMTKMCFLCLPGKSIEDTAKNVIGMVADFLAYIVVSSISTQLQEDYMKLEQTERDFHDIYKLVLRFMWALQADYLVRGAYLLVVIVYRAVLKYLPRKSRRTE